MNIAINTSALSNAHKDRGIGVYTKELVGALARYQKQHTYTFFDQSRQIPSDTHVVAYPFFDPFILSLPLYKPKPTVVTVHDLIPIVFPTHFPRGVRGEYIWRVQQWSLLGARRLIADSFCTKSDISSRTGFDAKRIDVVPLAARPSYAPIRDPQALQAITKKYGLPAKYFLYVGDINWNKNILGLLKAWHQYVTQYKQDRGYKLVMVGRAFTDKATREAREIYECTQSLDVQNSVQFAGYIADEDLPGVYMMAVATIVPSLYEGFGLPLLEAMASGGVVLSSDLSSLPEIMGPAIRIDPTSVDSISFVIDQVSKYSPKKRASLIAAGVAWVATFTWKKTAEQTILSYEKALARK